MKILVVDDHPLVLTALAELLPQLARPVSVLGAADRDQAYAMLAAHPEIQGVFCANDKMAVGALKAIKEAGKSGITVIGYDNIADVKPALEAGEMAATIEQHPDLMGKYGVRAEVGILDGALQKGREFLVPLEVIKGRR